RIAMTSDHDIDLIRNAAHADPFAVLGPHRDADGRSWMRCFLPGAAEVIVRAAKTTKRLATLEARHPDGFFEGSLAEHPQNGYRLKVRWQDGAESLLDDPYRFPPVLGEMDVWLMGEGTHLR